MPIDRVTFAIEELGKPDPASRSKEEQGRRIMLVDSQRDWGWQIINYLHYRSLLDNEVRRQFHRDRKRAQRKAKKNLPDDSELSSMSHSCPGDVADKSDLSHMSQQVEEEGEAEEDAEAEAPSSCAASPLQRERALKDLPATDAAKRIHAIFKRRPGTNWSARELKAYRSLGAIDLEDLAIVERYYAALWPPKRDVNILRHDLLAFLNHFQGEVDKARNWGEAPRSVPKPAKRSELEGVRMIR